MAGLHQVFLEFSARKLQQSAAQIETCLGQLDEEQVWARGSENENAVGNLVLHLCGNVRQWIVSGVGGARDVRDRDAEFAARGGVSVAALSERLRGVVAEAASSLASVTPERLAERVVIQNYDLPVLEAIYHVVEHFPRTRGRSFSPPRC